MVVAKNISINVKGLLSDFMIYSHQDNSYNYVIEIAVA